MASLRECKNELQSIINELRDIERELRNDRSNINIGEIFYANCLDMVADRCEKSMTKLKNVNTNNLADWVLGKN